MPQNDIISLLFNHIPDLIWAKDKADRYLFSNQVLCDRILFCSSNTAAVLKTDLFFIEREKKLGNDSILSQFPRFNEHPVSKLVEGYARDKHLVFEIVQVPFFDAGGKLLGTIGSGRDITRQKDRIDSIQNIMNVGLMEWNLHSNNVFFSDQLKADLGYRPDEIKNKYEEWENRIHLDDREKVLLAHNLFSEKDTTRVDLEYRLMHKDKTYRWVKSNTICRRDIKNKPFILISLLIDINGQKKIEECLVQANTELEKRIDHQNSSIEKTQSALKLLMERHSERKKDISENILSNMKGLVLPFIEKLKSSAVSNEQQKLIDIVESNLLDIVSSFSNRLMRVNMSLTPTELQVADLVRKGHTNKEISEILNKSIRAVAAHRENLRKKLGLKNMKINLRTYLLTVDSDKKNI